MTDKREIYDVDVATALREAVAFQSSGRSPSIHDYGRWRRALAAQPAACPVDTVDVFGIKNGKEHALGTMPMPPKMKARELVREQFGNFSSEDGSEADSAMYVCEALIDHMVASGWRSTAIPQPAQQTLEPNHE